MKSIRSTVLFILIIINIINMYFTLQWSVEQQVIYESPQIIMISQTFHIWLPFDSKLFNVLYKILFFVIKSYELVWRIMSFVLFLPLKTGSLLFLWILSAFILVGLRLKSLEYFTDNNFLKILIIIRPGKSLKKLGTIDPNNAVHFPLEFLKSRISSGTTPYEIKFKNTVSIMLTRNITLDENRAVKCE